VTDFPRGWTLSIDTVGGDATLVAPAIAGVAHVLDAFAAKLQSQSSGPAAVLVKVSSSAGTYTNKPLARLATGTPAAGSLETDSASGSELGLAAGQGESLTVTVSPVNAASTANLVIQGHDI
jgi:hypothetical protein